MKPTVIGEGGVRINDIPEILNNYPKERCWSGPYRLGEIIVYSQNTINAYSLLLYEWWVPLIKFMVGPTIYVRGWSTYLWYSGCT